MRMKRPPHPGRIVRQECIEPLGVTVTEAAARLGVTRQNLNNILNGKSGISHSPQIGSYRSRGSLQLAHPVLPSEPILPARYQKPAQSRVASSFGRAVRAIVFQTS